MNVAEPDFEEEVHRIVGGQEQQGTAHDAPRSEVVSEDRLVGSPGQEEVEAEEDHQRQGDAERIFVEQKVHVSIMLAYGLRVIPGFFGRLGHS